MKKSVKVEMYLDTVNQFGDRKWVYVCSIWGDFIEFSGGRWRLRDSDNCLLCTGNVAELHGNGYDDFDYKFINVIRY